MGDRANVKIKERTGTSIYVYTHWEGHEWHEKLQQALAAGEARWHDHQYLQRFLITDLCKDATDRLVHAGRAVQGLGCQRGGR